jgi:diacylglycerol kinase (ATP)
LNEVVNGLQSVAGALARMDIGLIPTGTGNDFAATLGIPKAVDAAVDALADGTVRRVDLGDVNGRAFVNVSAGGFLADVSLAVDPALKDIAGRLAYLIGGAKVLWTAQPFQCRIAGLAGETLSERDCMLFAVCNAPMIGGGRIIAPTAIIDDGLLDACIVGTMEMTRFVNLLRQLASGTHVDHPEVEYFRIARLELSFDRAVHVNTDGEVFQTNRCEYRVLPGAARFLAPLGEGQLGRGGQES